MDQMEAIWIKEEMNEIHTELDSVALEDPLKIEEHSLHIKEDQELKTCGDGSRHNALEDPLKIEEHSLHIKEEQELKTCGDGSRHNALEDPLKVEEHSLHIKEDPEVKISWDGSGHNMVPSTTCASNSMRLTKNSAQCCGISFEETVNQAVINDGLNKAADESSHTIMSGTGTQGLTREDVSVGDQPLSADGKEKFHCSDNYKIITLSEGGVVSFVEEVERQSSPQETSVASQKTSNIICNTQTALHNAVKSDSNNYYLISATTYNGTAQYVSLTKERPYKCEVCQKCFTQLGSLKRHALIHSGIKTHKCDTCGKCYAILDQLKIHKLMHSGIKPHKCDTCGKPFTRLGLLRKHALIHSGIKPHKCDTCGKSFLYLYQLKTHKLMHSGIKSHKCDTCGKLFTRLDHLKKHTLVHSGIKHHKCDTCGKSFSHLGQLKTHKSMHSGIKPHKCATCGKSFPILGQLQQHRLEEKALQQAMPRHS